jgi:hypothetical protein
VQLACDAPSDGHSRIQQRLRDEWNGDEALICTCFFVSEQTIEREIKGRGLTTVAEVTPLASRWRLRLVPAADSGDIDTSQGTLY